MVRVLAVMIVAATAIGCGKDKASAADDDYLDRRATVSGALVLAYQPFTNDPSWTDVGTMAMAFGMTAQTALDQLEPGPKSAKLSDCAAQTRAHLAAVVKVTAPLRELHTEHGAALSNPDKDRRMDGAFERLGKAAKIWTDESAAVRDGLCGLYEAQAECQAAAKKIGATATESISAGALDCGP